VTDVAEPWLQDRDHAHVLWLWLGTSTSSIGSEAVVGKTL
ncbi:uncharacterized protein METZ01_LOCUS128934, partial [marine metagenome]